ncbi:DUF4236 domain-containing protein [Corynebacterium amycolatum]|uniref:DUF4236 domain-containing protein n=1 Tax=Corynebacterium amycolatum TaxID=43765 RepID=UPI0009D67D12
MRSAGNATSAMRPERMTACDSPRTELISMAFKLFSFRKTFRPTRNSRVTLSRSGLGYSYRMGPVRWTKNARGGRTTTVNTPIKGLTYRKYRR